MKLQFFLKSIYAVFISFMVSIFFLNCNPENKTDKLIREIKVALKEMGYNADSVPIYYSEKCSVNARVNNGKVEICNKFFDYEFRDQVSIIWHEVFHLNNDKVWHKDLILLDEPVYIKNIPQYVTDYINNVVNADLEDYSKRIAYDRMIGLYDIKDSVYYRNEIAAYQNEINTIKDVSPQYDAERKYMLWKHTESLDIAKKYYLLK